MSGTQSIAGLTVMVIDDSNTIRRSAEIFLKQAGCVVVLAENGFDALAKLSNHPINLRCFLIGWRARPPALTHRSGLLASAPDPLFRITMRGDPP